MEVVLESVLNSWQLRVEITTDVRYCGSWYEEEPATRHGQFHLVTEGECWLNAPSLPDPVRLSSGDLVVFPAGCRHNLSACVDPKDTRPDTEQGTSMLCGELEFVMGSRNPIFTALPPCFVVHARSGGEAFRELAEMLAAASSRQRLGQRMVQNKLADALFTMAVCAYVHSTSDPEGIFAALADERLARVLSAVHARPGEDWTLQRLAALAGMSRTAFAEHFNAMVGVPPIQYLSTWRAAEARRLLEDRRFSVAAVAEKLGYASEAAFRRFFKRVEGVGPGKVRVGAGVDKQLR
jgi:AraC-like DNA-binding protein